VLYFHLYLNNKVVLCLLKTFIFTVASVQECGKHVLSASLQISTLASVHPSNIQLCRPSEKIRYRSKP